MIEFSQLLLGLLIISDTMTLTMAIAEAYLLYARGGVVLKQISRRDVCLAAEVVAALASWAFWHDHEVFIIVRISGRIVENLGFAMFMRFLISPEGRDAERVEEAVKEI